MGDEPLVTDGPFAETKEQLLGFYAVDTGTLDEAVALAKEIGEGESVTFEVRPLRLFRPGAEVPLSSKPARPEGRLSETRPLLRPLMNSGSRKEMAHAVRRPDL